MQFAAAGTNVAGNFADRKRNFLFCHRCKVKDMSDYSKLKEWLFSSSATSGGVGGGADSSDSMGSVSKSAIGQLAALTYCSQLVNAMVWTLDVRLPFWVTPADFSTKELTLTAFETTVFKFNANCAFLCLKLFPPGTKEVFVALERPFFNLLRLLDAIDGISHQLLVPLDTVEI